MSEKDLNIKYICNKTLLEEKDELVPIILEMIQESYKTGLCQSEYDNTMGLIEENLELKEQLKYLRSGEYYNQLRFENEMLQDVVDNSEVSEEDRVFIDCTHRNIELLEQQQEFINFLEDNWEQTQDVWYIKVLNKYKEIIGKTNDTK